MLTWEKVASWLDVVAVYTGRTLPWLLLPMAVLTFGVVVLRYGFDLGSIAMQESVMYLHALLLMLGMGYTLHENEHVRVDIFYNAMSDKRRALVNLVGNLLFLMPTCVVILFSSRSYVAQSWQTLEASSEAGGLPLVFLLKTLIPGMALLLLVQAAANSMRDIIAIRK